MSSGMPMAGVVVGGCRLDSLLGRGGMGTVYRGTQLALGREVAVKVVPASDVEQALVARFKREARTAASLEHPHTIPIYAAGEEDGLLYLVMRLVHGPDLGGLIAREGPLAPARAVALIEQVAGALDAAHAAGLVHRDVKPGNVLVEHEHEDEEHAYLSDFGLMRRMVGATAITRVDEWVGSIEYVAPEQVEGQPVDHRADIYSLAGVLYTALTGERPFPRDHPTATAWAHVSAPRPRGSGSEAMDSVIARGMAVRPGERFQSAGELAAAARAALGGEPVRPPARSGDDQPTEVHTRRLSSAPRPGLAAGAAAGTRAPARHRRWLWALLASLVLLAGGAAAIIALAPGASKAGHASRKRAAPVTHVRRYLGRRYTFNYPVGWRLVQDEVLVNNSYFRTELVNSSGTESVIIDRTPNESLSPEQKSVQVQQGTEHTPGGYVPINSQSVTLAGRDAFLWEFELPGGPPPGPYKVDVFLHRGSSGYAVLGSASSLSAILPITMSVAQSLDAR